VKLELHNLSVGKKPASFQRRAKLPFCGNSLMTLTILDFFRRESWKNASRHFFSSETEIHTFFTNHCVRLCILNLNFSLSED
jgi:hypothetical protein